MGRKWEMFVDKTLICRECKNEFLFSSAEQQFFAVKGLKNVPRRCPNCRLVLRTRRSGQDVGMLVDVDCADCGAVAKVRFQPRRDSPVYCTGCYMVRKAAQQEPEQAAGAIWDRKQLVQLS